MSQSAQHRSSTARAVEARHLRALLAALLRGVWGRDCLVDCQFVILCFLDQIIEENHINFPVTLWWQGLSSGLKEKQALQQA